MCADCSSVAGRRYAQLQKQAEQLQEELYRSETGNVMITVILYTAVYMYRKLHRHGEEPSQVAQKYCDIRNLCMLIFLSYI